MKFAVGCRAPSMMTNVAPVSRSSTTAPPSRQPALLRPVIRPNMPTAASASTATMMLPKPAPTSRRSGVSGGSASPATSADTVRCTAN